MGCGCSKILVKFEFKTMYEPGEDAPPQFEKEDETLVNMSYVPMYSDRVQWNDQEYFVYHLKHNLSETKNSHGTELCAVNVVVTCTRKVFHPPKR